MTLSRHIKPLGMASIPEAQDLPPTSEQVRAAIRATVLRFVNSTQISAQPTHFRLNANLDTTVLQCSQRYEQRQHHRRFSGLVFYRTGIETAEAIDQLLENPEPERLEELSTMLCTLQQQYRKVLLLSLHAHVRNEGSAKLTTMVNQIRHNYMAKMNMFEYNRKIFLLYTCIITCELWGLAQWKASIRRGTDPRLTYYEWQEMRYANSILLDQLRRAIMVCRWMKCIYNEARRLGRTWTKHLDKTRAEWNRNFDEVIAVRGYARELSVRHLRLTARVDLLRGDGSSEGGRTVDGRQIDTDGEMSFGEEGADASRSRSDGPLST